MPPIITIIDSACLFFVDVNNNPTINGIRNRITRTSNLSCVAKEANPIQNSSEIKDSCCT